MTDFTEILRQASEGDARASDEFLPLVYDDLRRYVTTLLARDTSSGWDATDIVHEAYLRLVDQTRASYRDRLHFFSVAAMVVRRVLIDHARRQQAVKRSGGGKQITLDSKLLGTSAQETDVLAIHEGLRALEAEEPRSARLVELRFFGGLTLPESSDLLGISVSTAERDWRYARAFLFRFLSTD